MAGWRQTSTAAWSKASHALWWGPDVVGALGRFLEKTEEKWTKTSCLARNCFFLKLYLKMVFFRTKMGWWSSFWTKPGHPPIYAIVVTWIYWYIISAPWTVPSVVVFMMSRVWRNTLLSAQTSWTIHHHGLWKVDDVSLSSVVKWTSICIPRSLQTMTFINEVQCQNVLWSIVSATCSKCQTNNCRSRTAFNLSLTLDWSPPLGVRRWRSFGLSTMPFLGEITMGNR